MSKEPTEPTEPSMPPPYRFRAGAGPLLVSIPHAGTALTPAVSAGLNATGAALSDTDWHVPRLYGFLDDSDANILEAQYSRYVVDLNRPADDTPLYRGATTGLFPEITFDGDPLFREGAAPSAEAREASLETIWQPYHNCIAETLAGLRERHGYALLLDAHSIRSQVPRLFDGPLPALNIGTADGTSCADDLEARVRDVCAAAPGYDSVVNGRFKGGHITRHHGRPQENIHAVQLELAQRHYMQETAPFEYRPERAEQLQGVLRQVVQTMLEWRPGQG
jgi:N-formylglutamate amidohydrolase